jgi:hypothetical protein
MSRWGLQGQGLLLSSYPDFSIINIPYIKVAIKYGFLGY